jgi:hypothetical protein
MTNQEGRMCYSASASFIAGGVLTAASISIARLHKEKTSVPVSLIPAVFATHQFIEGCIWLHQDGWGFQAFLPALVFLYVLIAYIFWPVFIPFSAYCMESDHRRRIVIAACQVIGLAVGLNYLLGILKNPPSVSVSSCNLSYLVNSPIDLSPAYLFAVILPFLLSTHRGVVLFGLGVAVSCGLALYLESLPSFPSVWCFFAAVLSGGLYAYFKSAYRSAVPQAGALGKPAG